MNIVNQYNVNKSNMKIYLGVKYDDKLNYINLIVLIFNMLYYI